MERRSGIVSFGLFLALGSMITFVIVSGGAMVRYWSERTGQLMVMGGVLLAGMVVAGLIRRRVLVERRKERFAAATAEAAAALAAAGSAAAPSTMEARRSAGQATPFVADRPLPPPRPVGSPPPTAGHGNS